MAISQNELENNVSSANQLLSNDKITFSQNGGQLKFLFVGNSITRHGPKADIGWHGDWGMAASSKEKDYVHRLVAMLEEKYGKVDYCIAQLADWERGYLEGKRILEEQYASVRAFAADVIVIRIGENMPKGSAPACKPQFCEMIEYFKAAPNAKVVVTDSFWRNDDRDEMIRELAQEQGYTFCHITDLETDPSTMALGLFEHRGVSRHPSDFGMEMIAKRLFDSITRVVR